MTIVREPKTSPGPAGHRPAEGPAGHRSLEHAGNAAHVMDRMGRPVPLYRRARLPEPVVQEEFRTRRPEWLKVRAPGGENYLRLKKLARGLNLHTVCEEAMCPNIGECWNAGTLTFMILGSVCTRACGFCNVTFGRPPEYDTQEPVRVAQAVAELELEHVVITSVARDDLPDGGAHIFAETIRQTRRLDPRVGIEVLIPDFRGRRESLREVMEARPDILNHNVETVARLQKQVRPSAAYERSLSVLRMAKEMDPTILTKSGMMLGLGEEREEILQTMDDLRAIGVDIMTIGQYLRPSQQHLPLVRYYTPQEFEELAREGRRRGFGHVESGPLVRSSYHAEKQVPGSRASRQEEAGSGASRQGPAPGF